MKKRTTIISIWVLAITMWSLTVIAAEPIRIGSPLLLSGRGAFVGGAEKDTLEMLTSELNAAGGINGRPVEFVFYDTEGKPDMAVRMVTRLIQKDKVDAIIGISTSWTAMPAIPIVEKYRVPTIMLGSASSIVNPVKKWVFKTPVDDTIVVGKLLSDMRAQGIQQIAVMSSQDGFGDGGHQQLVDQSASFGIKIVFDDKYTMEDTDLTPMLNKIKKTDAQAVVNWSSSRAPVIVTMNYRQVGLELPLYQAHSTLSKDYLEASGKNAEGVKTAAFKFYGAADLPDSDPQKKVILDYQKAYKEKFGKDANQFGACAFDAFNIMVAAMKKAGTDNEKVRDAIEKTSGYVGINGVFNYTQDDHGGLSPENMVIYQVIGQKWKIVK
jgi:branched-chain amino acid transport system substrate-binding protein